MLWVEVFVPYCFFSFQTLIQFSTRDHQPAKLLAVYVATDTTHLGKILRQLNEPWFRLLSESPDESICVKLQKRCDIKKLTRIGNEDMMLLSNKLHSLWLPTRSHETDSGLPNEGVSHAILQFVRLTRRIKTLGCFFY